MMDLERIDAISVQVENVSTVVDWSSLVIEPENNEDEKGIPDEKPVNESVMPALLGIKTEPDERGTKPGLIVAPTPVDDLQDTKEVAIVVDDMAPEETLIGWDERHPNMDTDMAAFRKAIRKFVINAEFAYGTKKNEPTRFWAFCKGHSKKGVPCKWSLTLLGRET